ncbi:hypothetical protein N7509_006628 [Penicillium cosmopolitanum]|uniref:Uncharacterized protein n=1 Tax=Penicillium cosmopolitanum TaxID=1131564 RepID=A0A9W9VX93_9EURO|nr:uncharacterized protein N7509_006628 [Penicillium cosmopolitanum]KAJ5391138.1 hypothetical protein N7509_006628 [Penicillium cosmopolitanum]
MHGAPAERALPSTTMRPFSQMTRSAGGLEDLTEVRLHTLASFCIPGGLSHWTMQHTELAEREAPRQTDLRHRETGNLIFP